MNSVNKKLKTALLLAAVSFGFVTQAHAGLTFCGGQNALKIDFYYGSVPTSTNAVNGNINISHTQGLMVPGSLGPQPVCPLPPPNPTGPVSCGSPDYTFRIVMVGAIPTPKCFCNRAVVTVAVDGTSVFQPNQYPTQGLEIDSMIFFDPATTISAQNILDFQNFPDTSNPAWLVSYSKIIDPLVPGGWAPSLIGAHANQTPIPFNPVSGLAIKVLPFETEYNPGGTVGVGNWTNHAFFTTQPSPGPSPYCDLWVGRSPTVTFIP